MAKQGIAQIKRNAPLMCIIFSDERHGACVDDMLRWRETAFNIYLVENFATGGTHFLKQGSSEW
jgi:hypothetical protein